jgi:predicted Zn-dependent protease
MTVHQGAPVAFPLSDGRTPKLSAKYKYTVLPSESIMNRLGYQLLGGGKNDEAIAVFKSNVQRYPNSATVYDSLAKAYEKTGKLDLAKPNYERIVQRGNKNKDPDLQQYRINFERVSKTLLKAGKTPEK